MLFYMICRRVGKSPTWQPSQLAVCSVTRYFVTYLEEQSKTKTAKNCSSSRKKSCLVLMFAYSGLFYGHKRGQQLHPPPVKLTLSAQHGFKKQPWNKTLPSLLTQQSDSEAPSLCVRDDEATIRKIKSPIIWDLGPFLKCRLIHFYRHNNRAHSTQPLWQLLDQSEMSRTSPSNGWKQVGGTLFVYNAFIRWACCRISAVLLSRANEKEGKLGRDPVIRAWRVSLFLAQKAGSTFCTFPDQYSRKLPLIHAKPLTHTRPHSLDTNTESKLTRTWTNLDLLTFVTFQHTKNKNNRNVS